MIKSSSILKNVAGYPLTRIILGAGIIVGAVAFGEWSMGSLAGDFHGNLQLRDWLTTLSVILLALASYILFFRLYEKRPVLELKSRDFFPQAGFGFLLGIILETVLIGVLFLLGDYTVLAHHPLSFLIPGLTDALVAGFVAELLLRGVLLRLVEEQLGTSLTLVFFVLLFGFIHTGKGAPFYSVLAVAIQAGLLASATYIYSRSLWLPIFLHFAKDYAEPSIFGGINTGISLKKSLITPRISGSPLLTGGAFGPSDSLLAAILCLAVAVLFLVAAGRKGRFIRPSWKRGPGMTGMERVSYKAAGKS